MSRTTNLALPFRALERAARFLLVELWSAGSDGATRFQRVALSAVRIGYITVEGFFRDLCLLRASALTFASLMALVPTLALAFAVLRGLGWHGDRLEALILSEATLLSPEAINLIVSYIDKTSFAGLGAIGGSVLFLTFVSVMTNIEASFNAIWGDVGHRPFARRVFDYFGVMVVAPVLLAVATSLTAAVQSNAVVLWLSSTWGLGSAIQYVLSYSAYAVIWFLFAFLYVFIPNTRVRIVPALVGGIVAGSVWHFTQFLYIKFQIGMGNYNAIYGALAQLPLLMVWFYVSWVIVLFGAEISFAVQNVRSYSRERRISNEAGQALREYVGLSITRELAIAADGQEEAPTIEALAFGIDMPVRLVRSLVTDLAAAGLVHTTGESPERCFLSLDADRVPVIRVLDALRGTYRPRPRDDGDERVQQLLSTVETARNDALEERTLRDLAREATA